MHLTELLKVFSKAYLVCLCVCACLCQYVCVCVMYIYSNLIQLIIFCSETLKTRSGVVL